MMQIIFKTSKHWDLPTGELYPYRSSCFFVTGRQFFRFYFELFETLVWSLLCTSVTDWTPQNLNIAAPLSPRLTAALQTIPEAKLLIWYFPTTFVSGIFSNLASNPSKNCSGFRLLFLNFSILIQTAYFRSWFWVTFQRYSPKQMAPSFCTNIQVCIWVLVMHGWSTMYHFI